MSCIDFIPPDNTNRVILIQNIHHLLDQFEIFSRDFPEILPTITIPSCFYNKTTNRLLTESELNLMRYGDLQSVYKELNNIILLYTVYNDIYIYELIYI